MSSTPTPYTRQANFTSFEASNPSKPKPGASLDAEFNAVRTALDTTQSRLAEIQRDDGALRNGIVTRDSLDEDVALAVAVLLGDTEIINDKVDEAAASAQAAANSAVSAGASATSASASATAAGVSAGTASASAIAAAGSAAAAQDAAEDAQDAVDQALQIVMPTGAVIPFAGSSAPSGWLLCYGQTVSRATYSTLFAVIGTTYGAGDGSTTFALPDLRGRVPAGKDDMGGVAAGRLTAAGGVDGETLGAAGGDEEHTLTAAQSGLPAHTHTASSSHSLSAESSGEHTHDLISTPPGGSTGARVASAHTESDGQPSENVSDGAESSGAHTHSITGSITTTVNSVSAADASQAHPNVQPTIVLNYIIKA